MLEDRPVYVKTACFDPFPFPDCTEKQKARIRQFAEELDAHRKRTQEQHQLGLTDIYNVLEKVRAKETLSPKEKAVHDKALVSTLKQLHDDLDKAVAEAYGWSWPMSDEEILEKVVALNAQRAAEEAQGLVRWLRPDYQKPLLDKGQASLEIEEDAPASKSGADTTDSKSAAKKTTKKNTGDLKSVNPAICTFRRSCVSSFFQIRLQVLYQNFKYRKNGDLCHFLSTFLATWPKSGQSGHSSRWLSAARSW